VQGIVYKTKQNKKSSKKIFLRSLTKYVDVGSVVPIITDGEANR
jgi:hypothetical protein